MSRLLELEADRRFTAHRHGGKRTRTLVIVVHSTEGGTAAGAAAWFADKRSSGSTQLIVDDDHTFRTLDDETIAYGAHPFNQTGVHLEIAGFAKWTREEWLAREPRLRRAAKCIAYWCAKYAIPLELLEDDDVRAFVRSGVEKRGITTHAVCARGAYPKGGDHWDPGPGFPMDVLLELVRAELEELELEDAPVREHLADLSIDAPATPLRAGEGEHDPS